MDPQAEVNQWFAWTQAVDQARTAGDWARWQQLQQQVPNGSDPRQYYAGASLSPEADQIIRSKQGGNVYDRNTNQYDIKSKVPWETWAQIAAAGGVAAPFVAAAVAPAALAPETGGGAAFAPGAVGLGETGATTGLASGAGLPGAVSGLGAAGADAAPLASVAPLSPAAATSSSYLPATQWAGAGTLPSGAASGAVPAALGGVSGGGAGAAGWTGKLLSGIGGYPGLASAGLGLGSAYLQSRAAKQAAQIQADSAQKALDLARETYYQTRSDLAPYRNVGGASVTTLGQLLGLGSPGVAAPVVTRPSNGIPVSAVPRNVPMSSFGVGR